MTAILLLLLLFPLAGGILNALAGRLLPRRVSEVIACAGVLGALVMAVVAFIRGGGQTELLTFWPWIQVGDFSAAMDVYYDPLAAVMVLMVTFVSSLIHLYSVAFMRDDADYVRYFCYLNLFVFSMLVITLADNLLFVYLGWEGVGFCSYALIGFWYARVDFANAGRKAFILTRLGDVAFGVALALFFTLFQSFSITSINAHAATLSPALATALALLLLWAALGKSAQLPLTVWLPDAMAGPTPVSALIHAATMVTAGVYLLMRLFPVVMLSPTAMLIIAGVGAVTTIYASCAALAQVDIKRVLAYSTISQVGYMILAVGAGDIIGGMFHLLSHAFFKALLFLGAGCVIQALKEEHNIFKMGNLRRLLPQVYWPFLIGALSLAAFPMIGGFFSKDRILEATFIHPQALYKVYWALATLAAGLTVMYTFRMFFAAFSGAPRRPDPGDGQTHTPDYGVGLVAPGDPGLVRRPAQSPRGAGKNAVGRLFRHGARGPPRPGGVLNGLLGPGSGGSRPGAGVFRADVYPFSPAPPRHLGRPARPPVQRLLSGSALSPGHRPALCIPVRGLVAAGG